MRYRLIGSVGARLEHSFGERRFFGFPLGDQAVKKPCVIGGNRADFNEKLHMFLYKAKREAIRDFRHI
jgi:hypothetical protein